jgi:hypothetical protein
MGASMGAQNPMGFPKLIFFEFKSSHKVILTHRSIESDTYLSDPPILSSNIADKTSISGLGEFANKPDLQR